jgi:hypothetical protein
MAHEKLVLKELHLANEGKIASQTTLYMGSPSCGKACHVTSSSLGATTWAPTARAVAMETMAVALVVVAVAKKAAARVAAVAATITT